VKRHGELELADECHHLGHLRLGRRVLVGQRVDDVAEAHYPAHHLRGAVAVVADKVGKEGRKPAHRIQQQAVEAAVREHIAYRLQVLDAALQQQGVG
jgi:hypothetical protein